MVGRVWDFVEVCCAESRLVFFDEKKWKKLLTLLNGGGILNKLSRRIVSNDQTIQNNFRKNEIKR